MAGGMPYYGPGGFWQNWFKPGGTPRAYGYSDPADPNATIWGGNKIVGGGIPGGTYPFGTPYANRQGQAGGGSNQGTGAQSMTGLTSPYLDQGVSNNYGYGGLFQPAAGGTAPGAYGMSPSTPWNPGVGAPGSPLGPPTSQGNVTYSPVSPQEQLLQMLFQGSVTGQGGGPIGSQLFNLAQGQLPPALAQQIMGNTAESFGKLGARFGTDLGTAMSRGLAQASESQSLNALQQILGLGGTTAGFQFARGESGLGRAMQEFIAQQQNDPMMSIINALLGGSGLGG